MSADLTLIDPLDAPIGEQPWTPVWLHRKAAEAAVELDRVRREDCPRCDGPACAVSVDCRQLGQAVDHEEKPLCRWADAVAQQRAAKERIQARTDRLARSEVVRPDAIARLAALESPPVPVVDWYAGNRDDQQAHATARMAVTKFILGKPQALTLFGVTGSGKSLLAAWTFMQFEDAVWIPASAANQYDTWDAVRPRLDRAKLIVVDDLGRERDGQTHYAIETLSEALCGALDIGRRIIVTTNLEPVRNEERRTNGLRERYGQRLYSRLLQRGDWVPTGNTDLRVASMRGAA